MEDIKYLQMLSSQQEEDNQLTAVKRKQAKDDVNWMKSVVAEQLKVEKERQIELENLYQLVLSKLKIQFKTTCIT